MPTWNDGMIEWRRADGVNRVVQIRANAVISSQPAYWWRNEQRGESLLQACIQFAGQFNFSASGTNAVPCVVQEWSPDGSQLIQERQFGFTPSDIFAFTGD